MQLQDQLVVWRLYGRFCGLMVCGSCFWAVTWAARMMSLVNAFKQFDANSRGDVAEQLSLNAFHLSCLLCHVRN
jgi:hypothetical protein